MTFYSIENIDYTVGILIKNSNNEDLTRSKKNEEKAGQLALIGHLFPTDAPKWSYEESGKPFFLDHGSDLSFSHSGNVFGCQISDKLVCGIDVQHYREKITRVADKFLNQKELEFVARVSEDDKIKTLTAMWSCKEALYKMHGKGYIDYINRFTIEPFKPISGIICATADLGDGDKAFQFHAEFTEGFVLAFHTLSPLLPTNENKRVLDI